MPSDPVVIQAISMSDPETQLNIEILSTSLCFRS